MRMTKKITSIVLAVLMVVSMMSVMAVSANAVATEISDSMGLYNACLNGGEYVLTADITTEYNWVENDTIINGNGHKITSTTADGYTMFYWDADKDADLTLTNVTLDGNNKAGNAVDVTPYPSNSNNSGCNVNFDTVTVKNFVSQFDQGVGAVYLFGKSNGSFTNCTFEDNTVSTNGSNGFSGADIWCGGGGQLVISGGSYNEVYVNGGTANATISNGAVIDSMAAVSTSTVAVNDSTVSKLYVADKNNVTVDNDSTVTVCNAFKPTEDEVLDTYGVAQIGSTKYATLQDAITAAQADDTVKLLNDVTETITISGKTLTLDLNGFNITSASKKMVITAIDSTKLTIVNSNTAKAENTPTQNAIMGPSGSNNQGSLNAKGEGTTVDIYAGYYYGYNGNKTAINAINGATVTFWGGTVNGAEGIDDTTAGKEGKVFYSGVSNPQYPNATTPGYIVVHGGTFSGRMSDSNWGNYTIDGGTFDRNVVVINENPVNENGERVATSSSSMTKITDGTIEEAGWPANGYMIVPNGDGTFGVDGPYAAKVGDTGYATLAAAINAAQNGDTVKLLDDVTEAVSITGKTLTLDLNGYNITSPTTTQPIKVYGGTKLTIDNSNVAKSANTPTQNAILGSNGGTNNYGSLFASGEGTEVIIKAGYYYGYNGDKTAIHAVNKATVTFYDCVVNGAGGFDGVGTTGKEGKVFYSGVGNPTQPYAMDPGYIVVHGGTFSGRMSDSNWGNYTIDGGTFDRNVVVINDNPRDAQGNRVATTSGNMTKINDGTIDEAGWTAAGFMIVPNGDGTYGVGPDTSNPLNPIEKAAADINDGNKFGLTCNYLKGTLLGVQKKEDLDTDEKVPGSATTSESNQEGAKNIRFVAVLDTQLIQDMVGADDYGFVLAKVSADKQYSDKIENIKYGMESAKTISAKGTYNNVCGTTDEALAYGDPGADTPYKYVTCAVNDITDDSKIVARFYYKKDGNVYYAKYAGQNYQYTGCMAAWSDLA